MYVFFVKVKQKMPKDKTSVATKSNIPMKGEINQNFQFA